MRIEILLRQFWNLHIKISMENWLFIHFLSHLPGPWSFYTALENKTIFLQQFFLVSGGGGSFPPAGAPVVYLHAATLWKNCYLKDYAISFISKEFQTAINLNEVVLKIWNFLCSSGISSNETPEYQTFLILNIINRALLMKYQNFNWDFVKILRKIEVLSRFCKTL